MLLTPLRTLTDSGALPRRIRLGTLSGTWLAAHASSLGGSGQVAVVIEPATASEIASIVVEAYGLTSREVQVARLVARGLSTDEIASTLLCRTTPSATTSRPPFRRSASPLVAS